MSLQEVVSSQRLHIGFFGMRNAGKSSLVNAVTGQSLSVVSPVKGTTTDPVQKAMELLPLGPVVILDTPGLDDEGELGELRMKKTEQAMARTDIAVVVADASAGITNRDEALIRKLKDRGIPYILAYNKADLLPNRPSLEGNACYTSAVTGEGIHGLKEMLGSFGQKLKTQRPLVSDLFDPGDILVLVTPIDSSAPKGRLILPQQLVLRDILDHHGIAITVQDGELKTTLERLTAKPRLVITDSQVFQKVSADTPADIPLTSFSILMARYKGELPALIRGAAVLAGLRSGDAVLISEGCTHHRQCNDIGTVKMPQWIEKFSGVKPEFHFTSGGDFPEVLSGFALIVHCGGCMLNEAQMRHRILKAKEAGVPMVNYGVAIAQMTGILSRSLAPLSGKEALDG